MISVENIIDSSLLFEPLSYVCKPYLSEDTLFEPEVIASFVAAVIGGLFTLLGSYQATKSAHTNNLRLQEKHAKEYEQAIILAIGEELRVLLEMFEGEFKKVFSELDEHKYLSTTYIITEEYFVAYNANADKLGLISDDILRSLFIEVHVNINRFIEFLRVYYAEYHKFLDERINFLNAYDNEKYSKLVTENMDTYPIINFLKQELTTLDSKTKSYSVLSYFLTNDETTENLLSELSKKIEAIFYNILNLNDKIQQRIKILGLKEKENDGK